MSLVGFEPLFRHALESFYLAHNCIEQRWRDYVILTYLQIAFNDAAILLKAAVCLCLDHLWNLYDDLGRRNKRR